MMRRARLFVLALLALTLPGARPLPAAETPAATGKVFVGDEGLVVALVPLEPQADGKVLVRVSGSGTPFDGKAILHKLRDLGGGRSNLETTYHGRHWVTIAVRGSWSDARTYSLGLPGRRDSVTVRYDDKRSHELKPAEVYAAYQKQLGDGSLAALAAFDRKAEVAAQEKQLAELADGVGKACGAKVTVAVDWSSITDADVQGLSIASYCGEPLSAMSSMCQDSAEAKAAIAEKIKRVSCVMGAEPKFELAGTTLAWTTSRNASNVGERTKQYLSENLRSAGPATGAAPAAAPAGEAPPWGRGASLGERTVLEKTAVCTDGKSHYVVIAPHDRQVRQLYYGDGKTLVHVPLPPWVLTGDNFFEPRFFAKGKNSSFRGLDMRSFASVEYDGAKRTCSVSCGERTTNLQVLEPDAKNALLLKAAFGATLQKRLPHRLARDLQGRYFYIDKGSTPETEKSFRLFVGQKGRMKLQKMTNVVADSEGEIFATKSGSLRYVSDRNMPPLWIEAGKKTTLNAVPIEGAGQDGEPVNNYQLIYNELGVYLGQRLGNPCDDL